MGRFRPRTPVELLQLLWRRKALVALVTGVITSAAAIAIFRIPHVFESNATVVVAGQLLDRQADGAQIAAVTEQITSRSNLESLIRRYDLCPGAPNLDQAIRQLQGAVKLDVRFRSDSAGYPESIVVSYRNTDPAVARQVVTDLVGLFDQANATLTRQFEEEAGSIRAEIVDIEARVTRANHDQAAAASRISAASRAASGIERARSERIAINSTIEQLGDRQYAIEQQIAQQKRLIVQQQEIVRAAPSTEDTRGSGAYAGLLKRRAELEAQLKDYSASFTDKHPKITLLREQLAQVNNQIAQAAASGEQSRAAVNSPEAQELRNLQRELGRLETELEVVRRELTRKRQAGASIPGPSVHAVAAPNPRPTAGSVSADPRKDLSYESLRERYTALLKREDALRQFQPSTAGPGAPFFQLVDEPNLPQSPAAPLRSKLLLLAAALALGVGFVAAAIAEFPRLSRINDDRDVGYYLGVPVVALIPESFTPVERTSQRKRMSFRAAAFALVGAALVPLMAFIFYASHIFQILGSK